MVRHEDIAYVQELLHDIQIIVFYDKTSCLIKGEYEQIRNEILHLEDDNF